ncbi:MAG: NAD-dependent epimerase/dehydratase family protein [Pontiellaceae bacterium]|jgi:dTDP-L-rhamnose 4-epimerase|nr:NAD-dependent epimerase/dehydratase family protein [Pontiellaceae bacterium]
MKNILITGGAGFIGSNMALQLIRKGYRVRVLDSLSRQIHGENPEMTSPLYRSIKDKVDFIQGSVCVKEDLIKALKNQDVIVHLAAETGTGQSMYEIERYSAVNIQATAQMLDLVANSENQVEKIVVASSRAIYGEGKYMSVEQGAVYPTHRSTGDMERGDFEVKYSGCGSLRAVPTDENSKIHPSSIYGITKQVQEQMVLNVCESVGIAGISFRYQNVYGPGQSLSNPYTGILSIFSNRIKSGQGINIFEDGRESRDFVYIDDVVGATIAGIEAESVSNEAFNVGTGIPVSVSEVVRVLLEKFDRSVPVEVSGRFRIGDIRHNFADVSKLKVLLGYEPKTGFAEGIEKFVAWVKDQPLVTSDYEGSLVELKEKGLLK